MREALDTVWLWLFSNGIAAIAFALLTLFLGLAVPVRQTVFRLLTVACALTTAWFVLLFFAGFMSVWPPMLALTEALRSAAWLLTAAWLVPMGDETSRPARRYRGLAIVLSVLFIGMALGQPLLDWLQRQPLQGYGLFYVLAALAVSLFGLALAEQSYRTSDLDTRWALKFLCIALATMLAYDFVMYVQALTNGDITRSLWQARGLVSTLTVPLIMISALRWARWSGRISVSHRALLSATAFIAAGLYLAVAGGGSFFIQHVGGSWGDVAALLFLTGALVGLAVVIGSGQVRATARVLVRKHLLSYRYDYREQWLGLTHRLGREDDGIDVYERAVRAIAHAVDSPAGAVWVERDGQYVCVGDWNLADAAGINVPVDAALPHYLMTYSWVIDLDEFDRRPERYPELVLPEALAALPRLRLIAPLFAGGHRLVGFIVLDSPRGTFDLGWEEIDLLKAFGQQVGVYLDYQENSRALTEARQFEAFNRLTAFLMHDLKNIAGQQSLIVQNARRHKHNPEFVDDMIETVEHSVTRMQSVLDQLRKVSTADSQVARVRIDDVIDEVVSSLANTQPPPHCVSSPTGAVVQVDAQRLAMVLRHLLRNAQDATGTEGQVEIHAHRQTNQVVVTVADNGVGMTPAFIRDSLFQPFVSTKAERGMGIGAFQVRDFARAAGGEVTVTSTPGQGARFNMTLPCDDRDEETTTGPFLAGE